MPNLLDKLRELLGGQQEQPFHYAEGRFSRDPMFMIPSEHMPSVRVDGHPGAPGRSGLEKPSGAFIADSEFAGRQTPEALRRATLEMFMRKMPGGGAAYGQMAEMLGGGAAGQGRGAILIDADPQGVATKGTTPGHEQGHSMASPFIDEIVRGGKRMGLSERASRELPGFGFEPNDRTGLMPILDSLLGGMEQSPEVMKYRGVRDRLKQSKPNFDILR